jgi:hypothetical protein
LLPSAVVATNAPLDLPVTVLGGKPRPLSELLTTFHLGSVVLDPYTNESSWILKTAARILEEFRGADVRVNFVVTADEEGARQFMGPLVEQFLVFVDADRHFVRGLGLSELPAFAFIRVDGEVAAVAEGWDPLAWRAVAVAIAEVTAWRPPDIPEPGDPGRFRGTPALSV